MPAKPSAPPAAVPDRCERKLSGGSKPRTRFPVSLPVASRKTIVGTPWTPHRALRAAVELEVTAVCDAAGAGSPAAGAGAAALGVKRAALAGTASVPAGVSGRTRLAVTCAGARHCVSLHGWKSSVTARVRGPGDAPASTVPSTRNTVLPS
ncbi:MAG: hypothetical protein EDX89_14765 [Acidobacteria bacterium]|nr:MAG: hypothetical protein EDX89_14765 [Acidobacteriota bacterium]